MAKERRRAKSAGIQSDGGSGGRLASSSGLPARAQRSRERRRQATISRWRPWFMAILAIAALGIAILTFSFTRGGENEANGEAAIAHLDAPDVHSLIVDPRNPERILFGSHAGIQESDDGGFTWKSGSLKNADAMQLAGSLQAPDTLYATGHDVFQVSYDGGETWQPLANNLPGTDIHGFAQNPADPQHLYAYVAGQGVFTSYDGGSAWTPLPTQPPGGGMHLALASSGDVLYSTTESDIVASQDDGATWEPLPTQPEGSVISLAVAASDMATLYAGTADGLVQSTDGGASWVARGPTGIPALALAITPGDPSRVIFVSDHGAVYRSDDSGVTWLSPR